MPFAELSPLTLNRLSVYLRSLRELEATSVARVSSQELAARFHLSAALIRKDLAHVGELGIRGVGYEVAHLRRSLERFLGLDRERRAVIVGAGHVGTAFARFPGLARSAFRVVGVFDNDPAKVGGEIGDTGLRVQPSSELGTEVPRLAAELGILAVPASAAQENCDALVAAGVAGVLNFAPVQLRADPRVRIKTVDLVIFLEELAYFLR